MFLSADTCIIRLKRSIPCLMFLAVIALAFTAAVVPSAVSAERLTDAVVTAVHDGDTVSLKMNGKKYRTRLIGIDAPEMGQEPWGEKAKAHLQKLIKETRGRVLVETDVVRLDKYDRLLAYIWTQDRSELINERMLVDGYAFLFTIQPNSKHVQRFVEAQRSARKASRGIWGPDGLQERPIDYKKSHPRK